MQAERTRFKWHGIARLGLAGAEWRWASAGWAAAMFRLLCILSGVMTIPFGIVALLAPAFTFGQFGIMVEGAQTGIVRGYGAAALGYGIVLVLLAAQADPVVRRAVLAGSVVFNAAEVALQLPLALGGQVSPMIWTTIAGHAVLLVLTLVAFGRERGG